MTHLPAEQVAPPALGSRVTRGLGWSFANNIVARVTNVLVGVVLARILLPADYGVFTTALVLVNAALSMNELGVSLAIIRWPTNPDRIAPTVATLSMVWSVLLYAATWLAAPALAEAFASPEATTVIRVLGLCVVVDAATTVSAAVMTREFMQKERMVIDLVCLCASSVISVVLAMRGFGYWALAIALLVSSVMSGLMTIWWAPRRYAFGLDRSVVGELLRFGTPLALSSALVFLSLNADYVIVGRELGPDSLGFYALAFTVCSWPVSLVSVAIRRVSFAGFSRAAESERGSGHAFVRSGALVLGAALPMCAVIAAYAEPAVTVVYGEKWLPSVPVVVALCVLGPVRVLLELGYDFLAAVGRGTTNLIVHGLWFILLVPALVAGARVGGIRGVGVAHALLAVMVVLPLFLALAARAGADLGDLARLSARPLAAVAAAVAVAVTVRCVTASAPAQLFGGGTLSAVAALWILLPMRRLLKPSR